jgi:hypothetical protein
MGGKRGSAAAAFLVAVAVFLLCSPCLGWTITVDANGNGDYPTIQAAIDDANDGDTIILLPGTFTGDGNHDIDFLGKPITLRSTDPNDPTVVEDTVIDCNGTEEHPHRGFYFQNGEDANSVLEGLTILNGYVVTWCEGGGAIYCYGASPTIRNCVISNNVAVLCPGSCCYCYGGAIYAGENSNPQILGCTITGNSVGHWGWGGGIYCDYEAAATIVNSLICKNTAAGIDSKGGGIYADFHATLTIINCTLADNLAAEEGGAIYFYQCNDPMEMTIINSILWGNSPDQICTTGPDDGWVARCDIQGGWGLPFHNKTVDPLFANPAAGDYHLQSQAGRWDPAVQSWIQDTATSECIDFGIDNFYPGCNYTRELWPHGDRVNIGAYGGTPEASMSLSTAGNIADLDDDGDVDYVDLDMLTDEWTSEEFLLAEDLTRNGAVNFPDFAIFADNWLWQE